MSISVEPAIQSILDRLAGLDGVTVLDTWDDENQVQKTEDGYLYPYVVATFGSPVRRATDRGIVGSKHDTNTMWMTVACAASTRSQASLVRDQVNELLVDFVPADSGRITLDGGNSYGLASTTVLPKRYVCTTMLTFAHNVGNY